MSRARVNQAALGLLELLHGRRVAQILGRDLHRGGPGAGADHRLQGLALVFGVALDRLHQVGNQVGAPLQARLDVAPGLEHRLLLDLQGVVAAAGNQQQGHEQGGPADHVSLHWCLLVSIGTAVGTGDRRPYVFTRSVCAQESRRPPAPGPRPRGRAGPVAPARRRQGRRGRTR